jgi:hypothetical protein
VDLFGKVARGESGFHDRFLADGGVLAGFASGDAAATQRRLRLEVCGNIGRSRGNV